MLKRTGLSGNTPQKWLATPEEVAVPKYVRVKGFSKLSAFADDLEQALKADANRNKQDRRTGLSKSRPVAMPVAIPVSSVPGAPALAHTASPGRPADGGGTGLGLTTIGSAATPAVCDAGC